MKSKHSIQALIAASALALALGPAGAQEERRSPQAAAAAAGVELPEQDHRYQLGGVAGTTEQDRPFITGGVSIEEAYSMEAVRDDYRLWLVTADQATGAWLAGATATIRDGRGNEVLQTTLEGPYLLVDLQPGRYTIETEFNGQRKSESVQIGRQGTRQVIAYFNAEVTRSPDMPDRKIAPVGAEPTIELSGSPTRQ
jgi:hypothetical protein